ncbi:hypothetical protein H696_06266 [Fonticula alba]|uniref:Uncharacterized protein n=1 Tax=Fonticula alba TaxID=691883 RepID=A0A058Z043_FONAL|nr:hypothetical protein H696_06266 [Fonticula alba]KCV67313.1 hypothetical protein H696_06266 [Fonticula alba]|eukprot:XP_009498284.1 hypothetical protein H696_06266 [Fonticula alba]
MAADTAPLAYLLAEASGPALRLGQAICLLPGVMLRPRVMAGASGDQAAGRADRRTLVLLDAAPAGPRVLRCVLPGPRAHPHGHPRASL